MFPSLRTVLAALVFWCLCCCALAGQALADIRLGILPRLSAVELYSRFSPLAEYLSKASGEKVTIVIPKDFAAFRTAVDRGEIDVAFANPLVYVQLCKSRPAELLAVASEGKSGTRFRGVVIVRKDSALRTLGDLRGKKVLFVDQASAAGYVFQVLLLKRAGLEIGRDLERLPFAKKHDNVVRAVLNGVADAGGLRESDLETLGKKHDLSGLRILAYTDFYPNWPVFAMTAAKPEAVARIKAALLKLREHAPGTDAVLKSAQLSGFSPIADHEYAALRKAAGLVGAL